MSASPQRVVLGVSGGIAAYKSSEIVRLLKEKNIDVHVVMTKAATEFVAPLTFQALSGNVVHTSLFDLTEESQMGHIALADSADLICVAPATADVMARLAHGLCDDLLTTLICASQAPKLLIPAMNVHMWENSATQANLVRLRELGFEVMEPASGSLACGYEGKGRMPEPRLIVDQIEMLLSNGKLLHGKRVLVTAGPTREFWDAFRFLSNPSSGKMGLSFAEAARALGAQVTLLLGPSSICPPSGMTVHRFESAEDLLKLSLQHAKDADVVIMAAAVSDYTFAEKKKGQKIKKGADSLSLSLTPTVDILKTLGKAAKRPFLIGFAAETENLEGYAREKLKEKSCDVVLANLIGGKGGGFESDDNTLLIVTKKKSSLSIGPLPKRDLAMRVLREIYAILPRA